MNDWTPPEPVSPPCECLRCVVASYYRPESSPAAVTAAPAAGETPPRQDSSPGVGATKPESGISDSIYCPCGIPTTYHRTEDGSITFRCDFCDQTVATATPRSNK
jgi:hypothetical protein